MKRFALIAAVALGGIARADAPTLKLELQTGVSLYQAYTLDGTVRPPAVGYQIGTTLFHVKANGGVYDLSVEGVGFTSLGGAFSGGFAGCVAPHEGGWVGGAICVGAAVDAFNAQTRRGLIQGNFRWKESLPLFASAGLHF